MTRRGAVLLVPVAVVAALALSAWTVRPRTAITRDNAQEIHVGMTRAEVEALLGGPTRSEVTGPTQYDVDDGEARELEERKAVYMASRRATTWDHLGGWSSDEATVQVVYDAGWRVCALYWSPTRRVYETPLEMLHRWLNR